MKKFTFLMFLIVLFLSTQAQVTITQADVASTLTLGKTVKTYADTLNTNVNIGATGQSSWDFSGHPHQLNLMPKALIRAHLRSQEHLAQLIM